MINLNCKLSQCRQLAKLKVLGNMTIIEVKVKQRTWGGKGRGNQEGSDQVKTDRAGTSAKADH